MVPDLWSFDLPFVFWLCDGAKVMCFSRNHTSSVEFWSFPGRALGSQILSRDAGWWPHRPLSPAITKMSNQYTHSVPRQPFCFSLLVWYPVLSMRQSTFRYKIGFVLDDLAQSQVNVSILSTFKVGQVYYDVWEVGCIKYTFELWDFPFRMSLSGWNPTVNQGKSIRTPAWETNVGYSVRH